MGVLVRNIWLFGVAMALLCAPAFARSMGEFHLLEPVRDKAGRALEQAGPDGRQLPVAKPYAGPLMARLQVVLESGAAALLPVMDRQARAASPFPADCPPLGKGIVIYLSDEDGGFARKDFWLEAEPGHRQLCADQFIDITVDSASLDDGTFEEVLTHEFGHVLLRRLLGPIPATPSRQAHSVLTVTDPVTAFDEGFGIQLQPLAARMSQTAGFRMRTNGQTPPSPADLWFSRRETWLREVGVPHNEFVFENPPAPEGIDDHARWLANETALPSDLCHLKSGNAMVASEGVVATVLYRLLDGGGSRADVARRYERLVTVLARMGSWSENSPSPLITLVRRWGEIYPDDRASVTGLFLESTFGATASRAARDGAQHLSCAGAHGSLAEFVASLKTHRSTMAKLTGDVLSGSLSLDAALGPSLWLADPAIQIPTQLWSEAEKGPLVVDLNSTNETALALLLRNRDLASRLLDCRQDGPFASLDDASQRCALDARQNTQLRALAALYSSLPPYVRQ